MYPRCRLPVAGWCNRILSGIVTRRDTCGPAESPPRAVLTVAVRCRRRLPMSGAGLRRALALPAASVGPPRLAPRRDRLSRVSRAALLQDEATQPPAATARRGRPQRRRALGTALRQPVVVTVLQRGRVLNQSRGCSSRRALRPPESWRSGVAAGWCGTLRRVWSGSGDPA